MLHATIKSLLSRKVRLLLSGMAVVLGVLFVSGSFVLTDTMTNAFNWNVPQSEFGKDTRE